MKQSVNLKAQVDVSCVTLSGGENEIKNRILEGQRNCSYCDEQEQEHWIKLKVESLLEKSR